MLPIGKGNGNYFGVCFSRDPWHLLGRAWDMLKEEFKKKNATD